MQSRLKRWQKEKLITEDQATKILTFEKTHKQRKLVKNLTSVGVFTIILGILALVASNWSAIPPTIKLVSHFILNAGLAAFMLRTREEKQPIIKDACVAALFGLFLTFIALVGQVYQLHGDLHSTLLFWLAICTPFIWVYGRTAMTALPWLAAILIALYLNISYYLHDIDSKLLMVGSLISFYLPIVLLLAAQMPWIKKHRTPFAKTFYSLGIWLPALFANLAIFLFYFDNQLIENPTAHIFLMCIGLFAIFILFNPKGNLYKDRTNLWAYLMLSGIFMILPFAFPTLESNVLAAILFIAYWISIAWIGANIQSSSLVDTAIRLVILRIFIIYLEVFGSLLTTGIGLIVSGIILLIILKNLNKIVSIGRKLVNYEIA